MISEKGKTGIMIIAIPTIDRQVCLHFGHCEQFALVEVDQAAKTIIKVDYVTPPPHEPGVLPGWLHEKGANVIIAGGMGQRAQGLFARNGIEVVVGAANGTPEEIATGYLNRTLVTGRNPCGH